MASKGAVDCILKEKQALARQKDLFANGTQEQRHG